MAKVRSGKLGKGTFIGPGGKSLLRPNLTGAQPISGDYKHGKFTLEEYQKELEKFNKNLSKTIITLAEAESLQAHAEAVRVRLK